MCDYKTNVKQHDLLTNLISQRGYEHLNGFQERPFLTSILYSVP